MILLLLFLSLDCFNFHSYFLFLLYILHIFILIIVFFIVPIIYFILSMIFEWHVSYIVVSCDLACVINLAHTIVLVHTYSCFIFLVLIKLYSLPVGSMPLEAACLALTTAESPVRATVLADRIKTLTEGNGRCRVHYNNALPQALSSFADPSLFRLSAH
jgi:hypothetical protein